MLEENIYSLVYNMTLAMLVFVMAFKLIEPHNEKYMKGLYVIGLISYEIYFVHGDMPSRTWKREASSN